jgi:hypothetical protein
MATIVTGYFKLKQSKASHEKYSQWMSNMLIINNPMVIFCDVESVDLIKTLRNLHLDKTKIIPIDISEFYSYRYLEDFLEHTKMDTELRVGHSVELYMIWSEKSHFLKRAIDMNPFQTDYFVWCDIGCFRVPNTLYLKWPSPDRVNALPKDKVLLLSVVPFSESELNIDALEKLPSFQFNNRIGGTIFAGTGKILLEWHNKYYEMLEHFIRINRFIGKDQSIMNSVYLLNREMCHLVNWEKGCRDSWFYLQDYLSDNKK